MMLTVDCGNTRLKWALYGATALAEGAPPLVLQQGSVAVGAISDLAAPWNGLPQPQAIVIGNVAGEMARAALLPNSGWTAGRRSSPPGRAATAPVLW